jgi:hypothetical protein
MARRSFMMTFFFTRHQLETPTKINNLNQFSGISPSYPPSPTPSCLYVLPNTHINHPRAPTVFSLLFRIYLYFSHPFSSFLAFSRLSLPLFLGFALSFVPPFSQLFSFYYGLSFYPCLTLLGPSPWLVPLARPPGPSPVLSLWPLGVDRSVLSVPGHCAPRDNKPQSTPL